MAFRSELDAARIRADAAEAEARRLKAELAAQAARIADVEDVEVQLAGARAHLAEHARPKPWWTHPLVTAFGGVVAAAAGVGLWASSEGARLRDETSAATERTAEHLRECEEDADAARSESEVARRERRELAAAFTRASDDAWAMVTLAEGGRTTVPPRGIASWLGGTSVGPITAVEGAAPVDVGAECALAAATRDAPDGDCFAYLSCGSPPLTIHSFGCTDRGSTRVERTGAQVRIRDDSGAWTIVLGPRIDRPLAAPVPAPAAPSPGPSALPRPPPVDGRGIPLRPLPR